MVPARIHSLLPSTKIWKISRAQRIQPNTAEKMSDDLWLEAVIAFLCDQDIGAAK